MKNSIVPRLLLVPEVRKSLVHLLAAVAAPAAVALCFLVPAWSHAGELDLTSSGASGTINDAIFTQGSIQPAGTGVFGTFLQIQGQGNKQTVESGFNTDFRKHGKAPLDDKSDAPHNHSLLLSDIGTVTINGKVYRQFNLDINEPNGNGGKSDLSLDKLQIYTATTGNIGTLSDLQSQHQVYDMGGTANWVKLNGGLSHGSGSSDMFLDVLDSAFAGGKNGNYVYLYAEFGDHSAASGGANGGFEEWGAQRATPSAVPAPSSFVLLVTASLCLLVWTIWLRSRRLAMA